MPERAEEFSIHGEISSMMIMMIFQNCAHINSNHRSGITSAQCKQVGVLD
jgi:hypothetical protein